MEEDKKKLVRIELTGADENLFAALKGKLIAMINKVLESAIDVNSGLTLKEEIQKFTSLGMQFAEAKLKKASIENELLISNIQEKYSQIEKNKAETRILNANAKALEFQQSLKELSFTLKMTKVLIAGNEGEESIIFLKQIDSFLEVVNSLNETNGLKEYNFPK